MTRPNRQTADVPKAELYRALGYSGDPTPYEAALEEAGLSRPAKPRISTEKRAAVARVLAERFVRVCGRGDCQARAAGVAAGRVAVPAADAAACEVCGGSVNRAAVDEMVAACARVGWRRLCIVGGSPATRQELESLVGGRLELRLVEGTVAGTLKEAAARTAWADRVIVWGATELDHKVSTLYRGRNVITVPRRGIAELARAVVRSAG